MVFPVSLQSRIEDVAKKDSRGSWIARSNSVLLLPICATFAGTNQLSIHLIICLGGMRGSGSGGNTWSFFYH